MYKTISYRKFLSVILTIVFFSPILIKATHPLYVHCEHHHIAVSDKPELHEKHQKCLICSFEFVEFITDKKLLVIGEPEFFSHYFTAYTQSTYKATPNYSFNLRAPPVL